MTRELQNEANRVAFWDKVQREVLRRSTSEVTKLLAADSLRRTPVEGGRARFSGGAESIQVTSYTWYLNTYHAFFSVTTIVVVKIVLLPALVHKNKRRAGTSPYCFLFSKLFVVYFRSSNEMVARGLKARCACILMHSFIHSPIPPLLQGVRKRATASMRGLRVRQAAACLEARSIERSWMAALARWAAQLVKARAAGIGGEIGELRILQREDAEVSEWVRNFATMPGG